MIRPAGSLEPTDHSFVTRRPCYGDAPAAIRPYDRTFWFAYIGNLLVMVAIALLFRYADFVMALGGTEFHLGWIVGVGMIGSLLVRLAMGQAIDSYGPRLVWVGSLLLFAAVCFGHLAVGRHDGPMIYLLRIGYSCALAGIFGGSLTFIVARVPVTRMAEMWGMLGTAGFVGMIIGPQIGDWLIRGGDISMTQVNRMFIGAGLLACASLVFAMLATRDIGRVPRRPRAALWPLLRRYHPGTVLLVGVTMGIGLGLPMTFVRPFAGSLAIDRISVFFTCYACAAIATRVLTRRLPERVGPQPLIFLGLLGLGGSQLLFLPVGVELQMIVPGLAYGVSHALIFPSVIAAASSVFPTANRGVGNLLILAMFDLGILVGAPLFGMVLEAARYAAWPAYPTMFVTAAALSFGTAAFYRLTWRRGDEPWSHAADVEQAAEEEPELELTGARAG